MNGIGEDENVSRPGRSLRVVAGDTVFGVQKASHIPVLFRGRGQSAALGQSPYGFCLPHPHTHTHTCAPHTASPVGSNLGPARPPTQPVEAGRGAKQQQRERLLRAEEREKERQAIRNSNRERMQERRNAMDEEERELHCVTMRNLKNYC